jgi:hypothetical protein
MKDMQDELMKTLQENFSEEDLMELAEMMEEDMDKESTEIKYSEPVIFAYEGDCTPNEEEYDKGVKVASRYLGMIHTLLNGGMGSKDTMVILNMIHENTMLELNNKTQLELARLENIKIKKSVL